MLLNQIFDAINIGIIILDRDLRVCAWNRWMEVHSGIGAGSIKGTSILDSYPGLNNPKFMRSFRSVISFGNFCYFSQKLHNYLFPFTAAGYVKSGFDFMQQSCAMGPVRDEDNKIQHVFIYVHDVTEVAGYEQKLLEMNMKDWLTGIFNRRFMDAKLNEEFRRCRRYGRDFSLIMFDIDHFKKVNDEYGHQCGDFVLKSVGSRISAIIRNVDYLARYGGEEFCCLLPETPFPNAVLVAERFRKAVMEMDNNYDNNILRVTISLGVAGIKQDVDTPEAILKAADEAMYRAKREGRNMVGVMD